MARHAQLPADSRALYCPNYGGRKVSQFAELALKLSGHKEFTVLCIGVPKRTMRFHCGTDMNTLLQASLGMLFFQPTVGHLAAQNSVDRWFLSSLGLPRSLADKKNLRYYPVTRYASFTVVPI